MMQRTKAKTKEIFSWSNLSVGAVGNARRQATKTNEIALGIFVVRILGILSGGRVQSSEMVLDLLTVEQSVVMLLEVMTASGKWHGVVGSGFDVALARQFVEGELERVCQDVVWLVTESTDGDENQWHFLEG